MPAAKFSPADRCSGTIRPPGSKSITNRAVICAALASGTSTLRGILESEDTEVMIEAWQQLGLKCHWNKVDQTLTIEGCDGSIEATGPQRLFIANSGTSIRFLTAALASLPCGDFVLDGVPRMRERPIGHLLDTLNQLGANCHSQNEVDPTCPPVQIAARGLEGGACRVAGTISSQYLSGVLMATPYARSAVRIAVDGELVSIPYVEMTEKVMKSFGVAVESDGTVFRVASPTTYQACDYEIEPDASAASYYFAAAAITGGQVTVLGLDRNALQGDVGFCDVLEKMGCKVTYREGAIDLVGGPLQGIDVDMNAISDTVQTLAAVALFADGPTRVRGVAHNRHKETDRIGDLAVELRRLGAQVREFEDGLEISPAALTGTTIQTYNDHRMAMSLALVGLNVPDVWIDNPRCTDKTYPTFFEEFARVFSVELSRRD